MLRFHQVTKNYHGKPVIQHHTFDIGCGEFFILVGSSGSGKTTTLKMINRLIEPDSGDIYFKDKRVKDYDLRELRLNMGYVLQQIALFPNLTVYENISLIPEMKKWKKADRLAKASALLEKVGLDPQSYLSRYPAELSGGEQQRVAILRAIITDPPVLLMDEPFSALDPIARHQLQDLIKQLHQELKITIVFVTHDMQEALRLGDRICVLKSGIIQQIDTPTGITQNPANQFVRDFFAKEDNQ